MKIIPVPCSYDNYSYILVCEKTNQAAAVDPTEAYPVLTECEKIGASLTTVLCTHHHNDHIGEIPEIASEYKGVKVVCHVSDKKRIPLANVFVEHKDTITIGELTGQVLFTPGHTHGSICYRFADSLLTGDTLFGAGCGRLFEGTPEQMMNSLTLLMDSCSDSTKVYFGHEYTRRNLEFALTVEPENSNVLNRYRALDGENIRSTPSTIGLEKMTNPFLRFESPAIKEELVKKGVTSIDSNLFVFSQLRELRNSF